MPTEAPQPPLDELMNYFAIDADGDQVYVMHSFVPSVDDMLGWLRERGAVTWFGCHAETPLTSAAPFELCVIMPGRPTYRPRGLTLQAALESAVRLVAGGVG